MSKIQQIISGFDGGISTRPFARRQSNQHTDIYNMWFDGDITKTRPGLEALSHNDFRFYKNYIDETKLRIFEHRRLFLYAIDDDLVEYLHDPDKYTTKYQTNGSILDFSVPFGHYYQFSLKNMAIFTSNYTKLHFKTILNKEERDAIERIRDDYDEDEHGEEPYIIKSDFQYKYISPLYTRDSGITTSQIVYIGDNREKAILIRDGTTKFLLIDRKYETFPSLIGNAYREISNRSMTPFKDKTKADIRKRRIISIDNLLVTNNMSEKVTFFPKIAGHSMGILYQYTKPTVDISKTTDHPIKLFNYHWNSGESILNSELRTINGNIKLNSLRNIESTLALLRSYYINEFLDRPTAAVVNDSGLILIRGDITLLHFNSTPIFTFISDDLGGKILKPFYGNVESFEDLPTTSKGLMFRVSGNVKTGSATYYVFHNGTNWIETAFQHHFMANTNAPIGVLNLTGSAYNIQQRVFAETAMYYSRPSIQKSTYKSTFNSDNVFNDDSVDQYQSLALSSSMVGDHNTVPLPSFAGKAIEDIALFNKRMLALTKNSILFSEVDYPFNFFRTTMITDLDSDPIDIPLTHIKGGEYNHILILGETIVIIGDGEQKIVKYRDYLSAKNLSLTSASYINIDSDCRPVSNGNFIFASVKYGNTYNVIAITIKTTITGKEYLSEIKILDHAKGLIKNKIVQLSCDNESISILTDDDVGGDQIYMVKYKTENEKIISAAIVRWGFALFYGKILFAEIDDNYLYCTSENDFMLNYTLYSVFRIPLFYTDDERSADFRFLSYRTYLNTQDLYGEYFIKAHVGDDIFPVARTYRRYIDIANESKRKLMLVHSSRIFNTMYLARKDYTEFYRFIDSHVTLSTPQLTSSNSTLDTGSLMYKSLSIYAESKYTFTFDEEYPEITISNYSMPANRYNFKLDQYSPRSKGIRPMELLSGNWHAVLNNDEDIVPQGE